MKVFRFFPLASLLVVFLPGLLALAGLTASWLATSGNGDQVAFASDGSNLVPNGDFELGNLYWWVQSGNGQVFVVGEGMCFSAYDTTGITLHGDYAVNIRSDAAGQPTEVGILTSPTFSAGTAISFYALSENGDNNPVPDPVAFEVRLLDESDTTLLTEQVVTNVVTLSPGCGSDPRDSDFSYHVIDTSAYEDQTVKVQFRQHTNTPGAGWFTLVDDVGVIGGEPIPTPTPSPFTPTYSETADEIAPEDFTVMPIDDECPVSAPCKMLYAEDIPDGQPSGLISVLAPSSIQQFAGDAIIPDGAIIGHVFYSRRSTDQPGTCSSTGTIVSSEWDFLEGTTNPTTTTGSPSDLYSFSNWPTQLDDFRDTVLADYPGSLLHSRWVKPTPDGPSNLLVFKLADGSLLYWSAPVGDPTLPPSQDCGPITIRYVALGVTADNPATPQDEGGIPLSTCATSGTQTYTLSLDRDDTPEWDPVVLDDTVTCSPNTPAGSGVSVPLNGGTGTLAGMDVTFSEIAAGGSTTVVTTTAGPPPPTGFKIVGLAELPLYFDINTDASYSGDLTVCVRYDETQVEGAEENLKLMQRVDDEYVDTTTSVDTENDIICGTTSHLSIFVVAQTAPTPTPTPTPGPPAVGGIIEMQVDGPGSPPSLASGSGSSSPPYAALITLAAAALLALTAGTWYARRRWLR